MSFDIIQHRQRRLRFWTTFVNDAVEQGSLPDNLLDGRALRVLADRLRQQTKSPSAVKAAYFIFLRLHHQQHKADPARFASRPCLQSDWEVLRALLSERYAAAAEDTERLAALRNSATPNLEEKDASTCRGWQCRWGYCHCPVPQATYSQNR
ncbi:hypothetical protein MKEN_01305200 [Mycena kentingensis (nom. inval.)]|nr:hypothetical protein MKEN_01305200 [Mycena kentingensis (nom. inval.)]